MRYTARSRQVQWQRSRRVAEAAAAITQLLEELADFCFELKLEAGQGIICNNVLHNRSAYRDGKGPGSRLLRRRLLRCRYRNGIWPGVS